MLRGLRDFLFKGNVVDLAVAVIVGTAFGALITSLVNDVLMPLIGWLVGKPDFSALYLGPIAIGQFLNAVVNFLLVGGVVYFFWWWCRCRRGASGRRRLPPQPRK